MRTGPAAAAAVGLALAAVLTTLPGCGAFADRSAGSRGTGSAAAAQTTATATGRAGDTDGTAALPYPSEDAVSLQQAVGAATAAVTAFARPGAAAADWWARLSPLLSPAARTAYAGTDPAEIPAHAVTGQARPGTSPSPFLASVFVPTDAGEYAVLLVRTAAGSPWLVERISAAAGGTTPAGP